MLVNDKNLTYLDVVDYWGLKKGNIVFLSSDITDLFFLEVEQGREKPSINKLIDKIIGIIGDEGTLIIPTYNWDFCKGIPFDWRKTKGKTGVIGNICLRRSDFRRTKHPIYSCAVWGKDQSLLCQMEYESSFGKDSIFHYIDVNDVKQIIINVPLTNCYTYLHYVEDNCKPIKYRYDKRFTAPYIDENGIETIKTVSMLVRDLELDVVTNMDAMENIFILEGVAQRYVINGITYFIIPNVSDTKKIIEDDIKNNNSRNLCKYIGQ